MQRVELIYRTTHLDTGLQNVAMRALSYGYNRNTNKTVYTRYFTVDWCNLEHIFTKYFIDTCATQYSTGTGTVLYSTRVIV